MSSSPLSLASNCAAAWPPSHVCGVASWPFTEDLGFFLAKDMAKLSEMFAAKRGTLTIFLSGGSLIQALRFAPSCNCSFCWFMVLGLYHGNLGYLEDIICGLKRLAFVDE